MLLRPLPPIGELAEVTIELPALAATLVIPNAAVQRQGDQLGVWRITDGEPSFIPIKLGARISTAMYGYLKVSGRRSDRGLQREDARPAQPHPRGKANPRASK